MVAETSKAFMRRSADRRFATRWFVGIGIDIGAGNDPLSKLQSFFPLIKHIRTWDINDGDAMLMEGVDNESYDFVHSSHCLEHLLDPGIAISNWIRICRTGGHIIITIPDEDRYEQGVFPSTFNSDHKWTFTIAKKISWSPKSRNIFDILYPILDRVEILKIELLDSGFLYNQGRSDQTLHGVSESAIEVILQKTENAPGR